jgi:hypothetical protein
LAGNEQQEQAGQPDLDFLVKLWIGIDNKAPVASRMLNIARLTHFIRFLGLGKGFG